MLVCVLLNKLAIKTTFDSSPFDLCIDITLTASPCGTGSASMELLLLLIARILSAITTGSPPNSIAKSLTIPMTCSTAFLEAGSGLATRRSDLSVVSSSMSNKRPASESIDHRITMAFWASFEQYSVRRLRRF